MHGIKFCYEHFRTGDLVLVPQSQGSVTTAAGRFVTGYEYRFDGPDILHTRVFTTAGMIQKCYPVNEVVSIVQRDPSPLSQSLPVVRQYPPVKWDDGASIKGRLATEFFRIIPKSMLVDSNAEIIFCAIAERLGLIKNPDTACFNQEAINKYFGVHCKTVTCTDKTIISSLYPESSIGQIRLTTISSKIAKRLVRQNFNRCLSRIKYVKLKASEYTNATKGN